MLRNVTFSEVDTTDEIAKEMNILIDAINKNADNAILTEEKMCQIDSQMKRKADKSWIKKFLVMKPITTAPKAKKKGSIFMKTIVSLVVLATILFGSVCFGQDQWPITYSTCSTPDQLVQLLTNRFSNQSGNYFTFGPTTTAPGHSAGRVYYHTVNGLYVSDGTAWDAIDTAGGLSLDGAYDIGSSITVDGSAVTLTAGAATNNGVLTLVQSNTGAYEGLKITNAGTDPSIEIDGSGTGDDITGTGDTWTVSEAGVGTFVGLSVGNSDIIFTEPTTNDITIRADTDNEFEVAGTTEDVSINLATADTLTWTTDSSVATVAWGDLDAHTGLTDITGDAADFTISHTGNVTGYDLLITQSGSGDNALTLTSGGTATDAIGLVSSAGITMTSTVEASAWTQTATGSDDDLTISVAGAYDASLILSGAGTGADAVSIFTSHANGDIKILSTDMLDIDAADDITIDLAGALGEDILVTNTGGSITLSASEAVGDAIVLTATTALGGIDITSNADIDITTTGTTAEDITLNNQGGSIHLIQTEAVDDGLNIDTTGGVDVDSTLAIVLTSVENSADSIVIQSTLGGIDIKCDASDDEAIDITNATGPINITSTHDQDATINIATSNAAGQIQITSTDTTADGIEIDSSGGFDLDAADIITIDNSGSSKDISIDSAAGSLNLTGAEADAAAVTVTSGGGIDIAAVDDVDFILTAGTAGEDFTIQCTGAADTTLSLLSSGTAANAIEIITTAGGIDITNVGSAASEDLDISSNRAVNITSSEATDLAINIATSDAAGQIQITSTDTSIDALEIDSTGGIDIDAAEDIDIQVTSGATGEDLNLIQTGAQDAHVLISATGTSIDAIKLHSNGGTGAGIYLHQDAGNAVTDAAASIQLTSDVGGIGIKATASTSTDAIIINAPAGGINMDAADDISIVLASTGTTEDLIISLTGAQTSSILIDSEGSDTDALSLTTSTNAGDIVINSNDKINMDSTGTFALNVAADTLLIQVDSDGTGNDDLTLNVDGDDDAHILLSSDGTSINTISLLESGTGTGGGILIRADTGTGAADGVASVQLLSDVGGIGIKAGVDDTDAIDIDASVGSVDIDGAKNVTINAGTDITIQVDSTTSGDDLLIRVDGDDDSHITLDSDGTSIDTIYLHQSGSNTAAGIKIHADTGIAYADGVASIQLLSDDGGVAISAGVAQDNAINIDAGAGGVDVDAALSIVLTSSEAQADAIQLTTSDGSGGIVLTSGSGTISMSDDDISNVGDLAVDDVVADANDNVVISAVKCLVVTISSDDSPDTDFDFDNTANNMNEQGVRVGVIPAYSEIVAVFIRCTETVTGSTTMGIEVGTATGGNQIVATSNCDSANDTMGTAAGESPEIAATNAAINVWINATPGTNWDTPHIAGSWTVCILYADYAAAMSESG